MAYRSRIRGCQLPDALVLVNDTVADGDDAVCARGDVRLVCDDDDGVAFGVQFLEEVHDLDAGLGIGCHDCRSVQVALRWSGWRNVDI